MTPQPPNRYFEAKAAGELPRVEAARRRTIVVTPHRPVLLFNAAFIVAAVAIASLVVATDPGRLLRPFGGWTLLILLGVIVTSFGLFLACQVIGENLSLGNWEAFARLPGGDDRGAHLYDYLSFKPGFEKSTILFGGIITPIAVAVAPLPLMSRSLAAYFVTAIGCGVLYWMPTVEGFCPGRRYYLYKPSPYIDMYDDPRCRHWVVVARQQASPSRAAAAEPVESLSARVS